MTSLFKQENMILLTKYNSACKPENLALQKPDNINITMW